MTHVQSQMWIGSRYSFCRSRRSLPSTHTRAAPPHFSDTSASDTTVRAALGLRHLALQHVRFVRQVVRDDQRLRVQLLHELADRRVEVGRREAVRRAQLRAHLRGAGEQERSYRPRAPPRSRRAKTTAAARPALCAGWRRHPHRCTANPVARTSTSPAASPSRKRSRFLQAAQRIFFSSSFAFPFLGCLSPSSCERGASCGAPRSGSAALRLVWSLPTPLRRCPGGVVQPSCAPRLLTDEWRSTSHTAPHRLGRSTNTIRCTGRRPSASAF